uniref:Uncharacterized protein n=1 Tax=Corethron hystrix TaxID=216773 RepID=A0A7S1BSB6_9STRA|mmetsp:Transcript_37533/g.87516  ORF Transcript_37533/g.87516 Transcript_37533/m.87516 type:complete len:111 (+) Transcript_37533:129-461(+)
MVAPEDRKNNPSFWKERLEALLHYRKSLQLSLLSFPDANSSSLQPGLWHQCSPGGSFFRNICEDDKSGTISKSFHSSWLLELTRIEGELCKTETNIRSTCVQIQSITNCN